VENLTGKSVQRTVFFRQRKSYWIPRKVSKEGISDTNENTGSLLTCDGHAGLEVTAPRCRSTNTVLSILAVGEFVSGAEPLSDVMYL